MRRLHNGRHSWYPKPMESQEKSASELAELTSLVDELTSEVRRLREENECLASADAHSFLRAVYTNEALPLYQRLEAARIAIKHETPVLSAVHIQHRESLGTQLKSARERLTRTDGANGTDRAIRLLEYRPGEKVFD